MPSVCHCENIDDLVSEYDFSVTVILFSVGLDYFVTEPRYESHLFRVLATHVALNPYELQAERYLCVKKA